jgi:hypothetical protein
MTVDKNTTDNVTADEMTSRQDLILFFAAFELNKYLIFRATEFRQMARTLKMVILTL